MQPRLLLIALVAVSGALNAQRPLNLGFELPSVADSSRPWGWSLGWSAFAAGNTASFTRDSSDHAEGRYSLRISVDDDSLAPARQLLLQIPSDGLLGRRLRLEGKLRQQLASGSARVSLEAWGTPPRLLGDSSSVSAAAGTTWQDFALELFVPQDSSLHSIVVQVGAQGRGRAAFDGLRLIVDAEELRATPIRDPEPSASAVAALARRAAPIARITAGNDDVGLDLAAFTQVVGDARIVGLGESTHGTHEFFSLKHRLLTHLVKSQDFTVFAIEANQLAVVRLNAYVSGGAGSAEDAMRVLFRVWNTYEVRELVEWMRDWNATHRERPLRFIGYDMQDHRRPADTLMAFLRDHDPPLAARAELLTRDYRRRSSFISPETPATERSLWLATADSLAQEVAERRERWLAGAATTVDSVRVEWAVQSANLYRQAARLNATLNSPDRDSLMAANLAWALSRLYPNTRAVVWAHDVHISRGGDAQLSFNGGAQMGAYLARLYPGNYRAVSLLTGQGRYTATRSFSDHTMIDVEAYPSPPGSVESLLSRLPVPPDAQGLLVDLRRASDASLRALATPRSIRHIGYAAYDYGFEMRVVLPMEFDAVFFIPRTSPSRLLP